MHSSIKRTVCCSGRLGEGGCLLRGVSAQGRGRLPRVGGGYPGGVSAWGMSVSHVRDRILKLNPIHVSEIYTVSESPNSLNFNSN